LGCEIEETFYEPADLVEKIGQYDAVVVRSATKIRKPAIDAAVAAGRLKLIVRGGVGLDNIDVEYARSVGIAVEATPLAGSASVAELVIGHMFCIARHIHIANNTMRLGEWHKKEYEGIELAGKTLGLIGFGRIAREVASRATALGMTVIYNNRTGIPDSHVPYRYARFLELLAESDFISLHIPTQPNGKPVIAADQFALMKDGVRIVNTARGSVMSEEALLAALDSGKVAAAALDVFEEEPTKNERLYTHPKISMTPHIGAATAEAQQRVGGEVVRIISNYFDLK
jgi:D-3-phosphoglycerate dehydrogenase